LSSTASFREKRSLRHIYSAGLVELRMQVMYSIGFINAIVTLKITSFLTPSLLMNPAEFLDEPYLVRVDY